MKRNISTFFIFFVVGLFFLFIRPHITSAQGYPQPCTVQGYKINDPGQQTISGGGASSNNNPYFLNIQAGTHTIWTSIPSGYDVKYSTCSGCTEHGTAAHPYVNGSAVTTTCPANSYLDIYWEYVPSVRGQLDGVSCTGASGWACEPGVSTPLTVNLFHDAEIPANRIASIQASGARTEPGFVTNSGCTDINHGFSQSWSQAFIDTMSDGSIHPIYAVGVDSSGSKKQLTNSPINLQCNVPAWWQTVGNDIRVDSGITDPIPPGANNCPAGQYASGIGSGGLPGVAFSGAHSQDYGTRGGQASVYKWNVGVIGANNYPETMNKAGTGTLHISYATALANAQANGTVQPICQGQAVCTIALDWLPEPGGTYSVPGDLVISYDNMGPITGKYVIFVNGKTTINNGVKIRVAGNGFFSIISKDDLSIDPSVGSAPGCAPTTPASADLEGFYSSDKNILIQGANGTNPNCVTPDNMLTVQGGLIANAARAGGAIQNTRSLCGSNANYPVYSVRERPDILLAAPDSIRQSFTVSQETAP